MRRERIGYSSNHDDLFMLEEGMSSSEEDSGGFEMMDSSRNCHSIQEEISSKETLAVLRLRQTVALILMLATVTVSLLIYLIRKNGEAQEFQNQYDAAADKIIESYEDIIHKMGAISGLGVALASHSMGQKTFSEWPFVSLPNFQVRAGNARELSGALAVSISHIVPRGEFNAWHEFVNGPDNAWIEESYSYQESLGTNDFEYPENIEKSWIRRNDTVDVMHYFDENGNPMAEESSMHFYLPVWQVSPLLKTNLVNKNSIYEEDFSDALAHILKYKTAYVGRFQTATPGDATSSDPSTARFAALLSIREGKQVPYLGEPMFNIHFPIFDQFAAKERKIVAIMTSTVSWRSYFQNILPRNAKGVVVVLDSGREQFSFEIDGHEARVLGLGTHYEPRYEKYRKHADFTVGHVKDGTVNGITINSEHCHCNYHIDIYPSTTFYDEYNTNAPVVLTFATVAIFVFMIAIFLLYDFLVEKRQTVVLNEATQSTAIVSSLFPKNVRERLMKETRQNLGIRSKSGRRNFMNVSRTEMECAPIAELFPNCSVFFADIAGFTAWSSTREPSQVFMLLQGLYQEFDKLAKHWKVFKVETIGDTYMAATGLPQPQKNHATILVGYARQCMLKMRETTDKLETTLGPGTAALSMRMGVHSGPVTAGVLRGDRARFQLFGDTVNTASVMESTGCCGMIQVSEATATLLRLAGKDYWLQPRQDMVNAKGKGVLRTFYVSPPLVSGFTNSWSGKLGSSTSIADDHSSLGNMDWKEAELGHSQTAENARFVDWMTELLLADVRKMVAHRRQLGVKEDRTSDFVYRLPDGKTCMDEVKDVIQMSTFNEAAHCASDSSPVVIEPYIVESLRGFVSDVALLYRRNHFHGFEHACHVTQSVSKLLHRIVKPSIHPLCDGSHRDFALHMHDHTYGICNDPLVAFALSFSSLIHDLDHKGISNAQLAKEAPVLATIYKNKSIAEQHSCELAFELLMQDRYKDLRRVIFGTTEQFHRFYQIVVNIVLATDIFDAELKAKREERWAKAFSETDCSIAVGNVQGAVNDVRATVVLEHIIQASDVSHCMQHWHVYQKWNRRLLMEMHKAYKAGRMGIDPFTFWYKGEIGFFDNYIIPLAKKLKECGVFGVSSDEYLDYALKNRAEFAERGQEIVESIKRELEAESIKRELEALETATVATMDEAHMNTRRTIPEQALGSSWAHPTPPYLPTPCLARVASEPVRRTIPEQALGSSWAHPTPPYLPTPCLAQAASEQALESSWAHPTPPYLPTPCLARVASEHARRTIPEQAVRSGCAYPTPPHLPTPCLARVETF
ncbi:Receptor-type guanylate cyclase gcy [Seminavis robusta]|uniref:Receptor-type guanylate cyclase gcy n=1 Tax=Seminavis robusta TaxID=568900 RepID=A0A9N8H3N0_9STRA|nr:Receptor-type guanylate cyclase gcy [Seminavis robusta]|eukprot:Sro42_g025840.1 Receptor-type guanylate cyclase gcy (1308) ;mRNA; r:133084-138752